MGEVNTLFEIDRELDSLLDQIEEETERARGAVGSIPAWAGEPGDGHQNQARQPVYPRVGGGTTMPRPTDRCSPGLSPRGRGNRRRLPDTTAASRSIPAWAGEPSL